MHSILPLQLIIIGTFFFGLCLINISLLTAIGNSKKAGSVMLYAAGSNIIINFLLIPSFGMLGASIATLISYLVAFIVSQKHVNREMQKKDPLFAFYTPHFKLLFSIFIFILILGLLSHVLIQSPFWIIIAIFISALSYIMLINKLGLFTIQELKEIVNSLRKP